MTSLGDWDLLEVIGEGAHAVVHRAVRHDRPGRVVAIKRLREVDPTAVAAIRREAEVLADLAHPAIAVLHDVLLDGDEVALVLALATGGSLAQRLASRGRLPADEVVDLGRRLGNALAAAHAVGVLHRDVTPANVLYGRENEPRLADFGLSSALDVPPDQIAGTATHLDPEVANGASPGPASDTWGLAVLLWESLAGQAPWVGVDDRAVRRAADRGLHLPLGQLVPDAPPDLVEVLERAIMREPDRRFRHPQELELALARLATSAAPGSMTMPATLPGSEAPPAPGALPVSDDPADVADVGTAAEVEDDSGTPMPPSADGRGGDGSDGPPSRTTVFGPRPPAPEPPEPTAAGWGWWSRAAVVAAVVVPLAVAGWAWSRGRDAGPAAADAVVTSTPDPSPGAGTEPGAGAAASPTKSASPSGPVSPTATAAPTAAAPTAAAPTVAPSTPPVAPPATAPPATRLPSGWVARTPAPPCDPGAPTPDPIGPDREVLAADVGGSGCAVAVVVRTEELDGRDHTVLEVPEDGGPLAGRYALGARRNAAVVGDWNGDGTDTPAVVLARSGAVFTFDAWGNVDAVGTGQQPIVGTPAVATDPAGVDHVVPAASLPDPGR